MRKSRVVSEIGASDYLHEAFKDAVTITGDQHVIAIAGTVGVRRRDAWQGTATGLTALAAGIVLRQQALHHGKNRFIQGDIDHLALAAAAPLLECQQSANHGIQRGERVADADADPYRRLPRMTGQVTQTTHGLANHAEAGLVPVGAGLAIAGYAHHDQSRVDGAERVPTEPPTLQGAGTKVFHQDVRFCNQAAYQVLAFLAA